MKGKGWIVAAALLAAVPLVPAAAAELQDVRVVNDVRQPVPVTGTVDVGIVNALSIGGAPAEPFYAQAPLLGGLEYANELLLTVPAGKVAVIELVTAHLRTAADAFATVELRAQNPFANDYRSLFVALQDQGVQSDDGGPMRHWTGTHPMRFTVASGKSVRVHSHTSPYGTSDADGVISVSGYYLAAS